MAGVIVIISCIILTLYVLSNYKVIKKNPQWSRFATLIQTIVVIWALGFAVISIQSANEGTEKTIKEINKLSATTKGLNNQFNQLSTNLESIPIQLDNFSGKLIKLDSSIDKQQRNISENLQNFTSSISEFDKSLYTYRNSIDDYSKQLAEIVSATDSQLVIWKDQQNFIKKEYSRKPVLTLIPDKCTSNDSFCTIQGILIKNSGNIEAQITTIVFSIESKDVINISGNIIKKMNTSDEYNLYQMNFETMYPKNIAQNSTNSYEEVKFETRKRRYENILVGAPIMYTIYYSSQYTSEPINGILFCK